MGTYVLGIHPGIKTFGNHDPAVAIFENGEPVFAVEEERLTREKHAPNTFPEESIRAALDHCDIELSDVETIAIPWKQRLYRRALLSSVRSSVQRSENLSPTIYRLGQAMKRTAVSTLFSLGIVTERLQAIGTPVPPVETFEHHACHAASAFYPAPFEEGLILTLDGRGEYDSTVVWRADSTELERVRTYEYPNSLGLFFGAVTKFLGYRPHNGEGKVMGLAPYGTPDPDIEEPLRDLVSTGVDYDVTQLTKSGFEGGVQRLEDLFDRTRNQTKGEFDQWEKNLAYVSQKLLEDIVVDIVERYCAEFQTANVGLAGGVALNCKMNRQVMEHEDVDQLFIQPVANDAGTAIGAASLGSGSGSFEMPTVYWGPEYDSPEIRDLIETNKISYKEPDDLERTVAERLADGYLVGWFQGRLELGPRALGNRSILADPRTAASRDRVNKFVKHREEWRPFAPSMLEEAIDEYLEHAEPSPYMIKTFGVKPERRSEIEAVLHPNDDTTRPQTVTEEQNPRYYRLIKEYERLTGVPVLLNTSFNDHGEPIVNTPNEAIKDFFGMGLDLLVIGDTLIEKRSMDD